MDINEIKTKLTSHDFQYRVKAVMALREYDVDTAVPLLLKMKKDEQFLVRSFVAMVLGRKKTPESFATLLEMVKFDPDPNVRAEASNSLSQFDEISIPHLQQAFHQDDHWLVRVSILAAFLDFNCSDELLDICLCGISGENDTIKERCINALGNLAGTFKEEEALAKLLTMVNDPSWRIRVKVTQALNRFSHPQAQEALNLLKRDEDHRVVGAVLEKTINNK